MIPKIVQKLWSLLRELYGSYRTRMLGLTFLGGFSSVLEGLGISVLIPLLVFFVGGDAGDQASNFAVDFLKGVFGWLGVALSFKVLLSIAVALFLLKALMLFWFGYVRAKIVAEYRMSVRSELYQDFLNADFSYLQRQRVGYLDTILMREVKQSSRLFENLIGFILSLTSMVAYATVSMFLSPYITILAVIFGGIFLIVFRPLMVRIRIYSRSLIAAGKEVSHMLAEILYGIKSVKAAGAERAVFDAAQPIFKTFERLEFKKQIAKHVSKVSLEPFSMFFVLGVFAVSYLYLDFNITTFVAIMYLIHQVFMQVDKIQSALHVVTESMPSAYAVRDALREVKAHQLQPGGSAPFRFEKRLALAGLEFGYKGTEIVRGVDLTIQKGEAVGIIGPSGAGKTTIVDLILRLQQQKGGTITLDGVPSSDIAIKEWRRNVVYVPQDVFLMNASIADNIRFFDATITDEEIADASKRAHIYEKIMSLPGGFASSAGERGTSFSGGERQRIAVARALVRKPSILILDEATSALDAHAEDIIKDTLKELKGSLTLIVIAHKPSTIDYVDRVVAIRDGKVVESGSPAELMKKEGSYLRQIYEKGSEM